MMRSGEHVELSDLELLGRTPDALSSAEQEHIRDIERHLASCRDCSGIAEEHARLLAARAPSRPVGKCPAGERWLHYAAGLLPAEESQMLLAHAASCTPCAEELRGALEDLGSEADDDLLQLHSSHAEWQSRMARRLTAQHDANGLTHIRDAKVIRFPWFPVFGTAIAASMLIAISLVIWNAVRNSDQALLARAYDEQRRTDLRFPGDQSVPMASATRGAADRQDPIELLKLRLRAEEHLGQNREAAYWHAMLGRIALVENNGAEARKEFDTANALDPAAEGLNSGLAAAYFEMGDAADGSTLNYAIAADYYGKIIDSLQGKKDTQALGMAYFNRALCWQRQAIYSNATKDFEKALAVEKDAAWRAEIQRRLDAAKSIQQKSEQKRGTSDSFSADAFLDLEQKDPQSAASDYENFASAAIGGWLAERARLPQPEAALHKLAELGLVHHDAWMRDMLAASHSDGSTAAIGHLVSAVRDSARGDADHALSEAKTAGLLFAKEHNAAGLMRAEAEQAYALQRLGRSSDCLQIAQPLLQDPSIERYAAMHTYMLLEQASCSYDHGDVDEIVRSIEEASAIAQAAGLRGQQLRAQGFMVAIDDSLGRTREAWAVSQQGLKDCLVGHGTSMATYQFLQSMYLAAETQGLHWAAAGIADAASQASNFVPNLSTQAYSFEEAGAASTRIGHVDDADASFTTASRLMDRMPAGAAADMYRADWAADRAALQAARGHLRSAVSEMEAASKTAQASDNYSVRQQDYTELSRLLLQAREYPRALHYSLLATRDAEHALASTSGEPERLAWERGNRQGYLLMVQCLVAMRRSSDALRAWEWYRSAAFRPADANRFSEADDLPMLPTLSAERQRSLTLVVARLEDGYVVWALPAGGASVPEMVKVATDAAQVEAMAKTLWELCANRDSSPEAVRSVGSKLYDSLFAAYENRLAQANELQLDLDPALRRAPIAALQAKGHPYLGLDHALVLLPTWWSLQAGPSDSLPTKPKTLLVEGARSLSSADGTALATLPEEYLETSDLARMFPRAHVVKTALEGPDALKASLPEAELFHFGGHMVERDHEVGLLLSREGALFSASSLKGISMRRCRLAVLATCSSTAAASYDMDDASSLSHALLRAGTGTVMATLWDVDSQASRRLMLKFYSALNRPLSVAEALRSAQQQISRDPQTMHPFFWASTQVYTQ